jgi:hypothetical protein
MSNTFLNFIAKEDAHVVRRLERLHAIATSPFVTQRARDGARKKYLRLRARHSAVVDRSDALLPEKLPRYDRARALTEYRRWQAIFAELNAKE